MPDPSGRDVGDVGDPQGVGPAGGEVPIDQVRGTHRVGIGDGREHLLPSPRHALDAQLAHQTGGLVAADLMTGASCGEPQLVGAVDLAVRDPQRQQDRHPHRIAYRPRRRRGLTALGRVVGARSHLQYTADGLDSELVTVGVDELDDH
jgi:hypothetical protein